MPPSRTWSASSAGAALALLFGAQSRRRLFLRRTACRLQEDWELHKLINTYTLYAVRR